MKKFLVLASILLALTLVFAACGGDEPAETTGENVTVADPATDAPTEAPTEAPEQPTAEPEQPTAEPEVPTAEPEVPTEAPTEEPTQEPETLPYVEPSAAGMVGKAIDVFAVNNTPYTLDETRTVTFKTGEPVYPVALLGWIGFGQAIDSYGYFINDGEFVYDAAFLNEVPAEDPVRAAGNGGDLATRFGITVPTSAFSVGENKVGFVVKLADGTVVLIDAFVTVNVEKTDWMGSGIVAHQSFDQLYFGTGSSDDATNGGLNVFAPGASGSWDHIVNCDFSVDALTYWGWVAVKGEMGTFGYQVNGGEAIYDEAFYFEPEAGLHEHFTNAGGDTGSRMKIMISLAGIGGEGNVITVLYKNAEGVAVVLGEFVVNRKNADMNVPMENWAVSGHAPGLTPSTSPDKGGMITAGGLEQGALLHQGAIGLGEIDLSKFDKVVIYVGMDNSDVTLGHHGNNANNRIMLVTADTNMTNSPAEETIIASVDYAPMGWALTAIEIDLTGVDYNGPVFVTYDTLPGTFMLVGSIDFIGSSVDPNYEPDNGNWVVDLSTIEGHIASWPEAGYNAPILKVGYEKIFNFGEVNLGQYSKIIIEYSYDGDNTRGDGRTPEQCFTDAAVTPIIGFTALDKCFGYANVVNQDAIDNGVKTELVYTSGSWAGATRTAEIDTVMYSGVVYLSVFNPWGTEVVISSVTFVK